VASFFGALLFTEHAENPVFQQNFFKDFSVLAKKHKTVMSRSGLVTAVDWED
jgi:DNA topoisomerase-1